MKIKFEWEQICEIGTLSTLRAKVFGGWLVRTVAWTHRWGDQQIQSLSESSVFVSDPNHEWEIE